MSFENNSVEMLKPEPKYINASETPYLDFIGKYKKDLSILIHARDNIEQAYRKIGLNDENIAKGLARLNSSIDNLKQRIEDFEAKYSNN